MSHRALLLVAALALVLVACGGASSQQTVGTPTPKPTIDPAWLAPNLVRDNPTRTATPTPDPGPSILPHCFDPTDDVPNWRPAGENSLLRHCQLISFYGYPTIPGLGVLGHGTLDDFDPMSPAQVLALDPVPALVVYQ